jgi:hypothetical protein
VAFRIATADGKTADDLRAFISLEMAGQIGVKWGLLHKLTEQWGKKAAARVFHICQAGRDVAIDDPFARGAATEKPVVYRDPVPGSPERAQTKYDVSQAMAFVATRRNNAEERVAWQTNIPQLLKSLPSRRPDHRGANPETAV